MQVSNDWPMDEPFGGPGLYLIAIDICEHAVDFYECEICFKNALFKTKKFKQKTKKNLSKYYHSQSILLDS